MIRVVLLFQLIFSLAFGNDRPRVINKIGNSINLENTFTNHKGERTTLKEVISDRPTILVPGYYNCKHVCGPLLDQIISSLYKLRLKGELVNYSLVFVSINSNEPYSLAEKKRSNLSGHYSKMNIKGSWHFLVGDESSVEQLKKDIGFFSRPEAGEIAHPSGIVIITPRGEVSQYLTGIKFLPRTLKLALLDANRGEFSNFKDHLLLLCSSYNPETGKYSIVIEKVLRIVIVLFMIPLFYFLGKSLLSEIKTRRGNENR